MTCFPYTPNISHCKGAKALQLTYNDAAQKGRIVSSETRQKLSDAAKARSARRESI